MVPTIKVVSCDFAVVEYRHSGGGRIGGDRFLMKTRVKLKNYQNYWVGISEQAISKRLKQLEMIEKEGYWDIGEYIKITPSDAENHWDCPVVILLHQHLGRISMAQKSVMLCVWWDQFGVFYYELLKPSESITDIGVQKTSLINLYYAGGLSSTPHLIDQKIPKISRLKYGFDLMKRAIGFDSVENPDISNRDAELGNSTQNARVHWRILLSYTIMFDAPRQFARLYNLFSLKFEIIQLGFNENIKNLMWLGFSASTCQEMAVCMKLSLQKKCGGPLSNLDLVHNGIYTIFDKFGSELGGTISNPSSFILALFECLTKLR
nr:transposase [Hymenolepis microstoma]